MKKALVSVTNKTGLVELGKGLVARGFEILSTGGTARVLKEAGVPVTEVADYTGFPEMMDGRVKTLHPKVHGGILSVRSNPEHLASMLEHGMEPIDIVVVNLYPFEETIAKPDVTLAKAIEQIDIGGPAMIRSASKNYEYVVVVVDPNDYRVVLADIEAQGYVSEETRRRLAAKAFHHTAGYDLAIARFVSLGGYDGMIGKRAATCKYGENAWQAPAHLYSIGTSDPLALDKFVVIEGTPPSFNNWCDIDRSLQTVTHIAAVFQANRGSVPDIAIGVKHGNACGACCGNQSRGEILRLALTGDPLAIFGGLIMANFPITEDVALPLSAEMQSRHILLDGIVAPSFDPEAIALLRRKNDKCRFVVNPTLNIPSLDFAPRFRHVRGGFLVQPNYTFVLNLKGDEVQKFGGSWEEDEVDLLLAWAIGSTSNSNTITIVRDQTLLGNGVGQQDRVGAAELAISRVRRSGHSDGCARAVAYSDSFFPFPDAPEALITAGVRTILTSSGSVKDQKTIDLCEELGASLIMVPDALARGFFGH